MIGGGRFRNGHSASGERLKRTRSDERRTPAGDGGAGKKLREKKVGRLAENSGMFFRNVMMHRRGRFLPHRHGAGQTFMSRLRIRIGGAMVCCRRRHFRCMNGPARRSMHEQSRGKQHGDHETMQQNSGPAISGRWKHHRQSTKIRLRVKTKEGPAFRSLLIQHDHRMTIGSD